MSAKKLTNKKMQKEEEENNGEEGEKEEGQVSRQSLDTPPEKQRKQGSNFRPIMLKEIHYK